jgi:cell division protein ZapA (FtsZ GTPase activity inhibitor)
MVQRYKVTIGGESYFLVSDEPEERVKAVAHLVDAQMDSLAQGGHSDDPKRLAVLVALQCASKMVASDELLKQYQSAQEKLIGTIDDELVRL